MRAHHILGVVIGLLVVILGGLVTVRQYQQNAASLATLLPADAVMIFGHGSLASTMATGSAPSSPALPESFAALPEVALVRLDDGTQIWVSYQSGSLLANDTSGALQALLEQRRSDRRFSSVAPWLHGPATVPSTLTIRWSWLPDQAPVLDALRIEAPAFVRVEWTDAGRILRFMDRTSAWPSDSPTLRQLEPAPSFTLSGNLPGTFELARTALGIDPLPTHGPTIAHARFGSDLSYTYDLLPLLGLSSFVATRPDEAGLHLWLEGRRSEDMAKRLTQLHERSRATIASAKVVRETFEDTYEAAYIVSDAAQEHTRSWTVGDWSCTTTIDEGKRLFLGTAIQHDTFALTTDATWFASLCPADETAPLSTAIPAEESLRAGGRTSAAFWRSLISRSSLLSAALAVPDGIDSVNWGLRQDSDGTAIAVGWSQP